MGDDLLAEVADAAPTATSPTSRNFGGAVIDQRSFDRNAAALARASAHAEPDHRRRRRRRRQRRLLRRPDRAARRRPDRRGVPHRVLRADPVGARLRRHARRVRRHARAGRRRRHLRAHRRGHRRRPRRDRRGRQRRCASRRATSTSTTSRPAPSSASNRSAAPAPRAPTTRPARRRTCCAGPPHARSRRPSSRRPTTATPTRRPRTTPKDTMAFSEPAAARHPGRGPLDADGAHDHHCRSPGAWSTGSCRARRTRRGGGSPVSSRLRPVHHHRLSRRGHQPTPSRPTTPSSLSVAAARTGPAGADRRATRRPRRSRCRSSCRRSGSPCPATGEDRHRQRPTICAQPRSSRRLGQHRRRGPHHDRLHTGDRRANCAKSSRPGTVLQAYLRRTEADCRDLSGAGSRIRLCKGAYSEPAVGRLPGQGRRRRGLPTLSHAS